MRPVPAPERRCAQSGQEFCYEWVLVNASEIRFIAQGDVDGIEYAFYWRNSSGRYQELLRVHPVITESLAKPKPIYHWGYPWDIRDIPVVVSGKSVRLKATLKHEIQSDGVVSIPKQSAVPVVLFYGKTTQPRMVVPALVFEDISMDSLASAVGANRSIHRTTPYRR